MDELIDLIYETVADPAGWEDVARRMSRDLDAQSFWMFRMEADGPDFLALQGLSRTMIDAYGAHFHTHDILMQEELKRPQDFLGRAVREQDIVGEKVWQASEIYNDLARPNGMHHILSMNLSSEGARAVPFLTFFRPPGTMSFEDRTVDRCETLLSHLRRAIRLTDLVRERLGRVPAWTAALLDQIPAGIFLLDGRGAVLHANSFGAAVLRRRDGVAVRAGRFVAADSRASAPMERIVAASISAHPRGGELRLHRAAGQWLLSICPLNAAAAGTGGEGHCRAWVWLSDPQAASSGVGQRLGVLFGLTAAEQRVAAALSESLAPADIAEQHHVSLNTVRTQVKSIFGKLGVRRQTELARLLTEIAALPRP